MDVISLMVRVSELTSSSYSAPSCRGSWVICPVEMRLYHCTSHQIRGVCGNFKNRGSYSCAFPYHPLFPSTSLPLTHGIQMDTNKDMHENNQTHSASSGERKSKTTCLTSFSRSCHINRSHPSHTQRLCHWIAKEGSDLGKHWRRPGAGGPPGLQGLGMLIGKIVLIRPSSLQMLGEG